MSRSVNKVLLIGNVGREPEIRTTSAGNMVAKFSLATNRTYTNRSGEKREETQWHRCTAFGKLAEIVEQYVGSGDRLYVEGRLEYSQTEGDDGTTRYWTDVILQEMTMLGSVDPERGAVPKAGVGDADDDLPF